jgi:DNA-binding NarL/FixJ family response regulator
MTVTRFIIVDDHPLFRDALRQALMATFVGVEISEAASLDDLTKSLEKDDDVDLILLDLTMPGVQGLSGLLLLRSQYPAIPVVIVSANDDPQVMRRCLDYGASGFVPKSKPVELIRDAVNTAMSGSIWTPEGLALTVDSSAEDKLTAARFASLTPQQVKVLMMLGEGLLNKQIAFKLSVSEATIKAHVSAILQKLNVDSRTQAVIAVNKIGALEFQKSAQ